MGFFDNFSRAIDDAVAEHLSPEILLLGLIFLISIVFIDLVIIHFFSDDSLAKREFKRINDEVRIKRYGPEIEQMIVKKFKTMPYRFYENCENFETMKFETCVPHYEKSKAGRIFFAVFSLAVCLLSLLAGLSLNNGGLISLSGAVLIPVLGLALSLILYSVYAFLKYRAAKDLEITFNEFLRLIKYKASKNSNITTKSFPQNIAKSEKPENTTKSENLLELMERIREVKIKGADEDKIKNLINDVAVERNKIGEGNDREYLTDALTDLLNIINKTA